MQTEDGDGGGSERRNLPGDVVMLILRLVPVRLSRQTCRLARDDADAMTDTLELRRRRNVGGGDVEIDVDVARALLRCGRMPRMRRLVLSASDCGDSLPAILVALRERENAHACRGKYDAIMRRCSPLRSLEIRVRNGAGALQLSERQLSDAVSGLPSLEELRLPLLRDSPHDSGCLARALRDKPHLRLLDVHVAGAPVLPPVLLSVGKLTRLESLSIGCTPLLLPSNEYSLLAAELFTALSGLERLEELSLPWVDLGGRAFCNAVQERLLRLKRLRRLEAPLMRISQAYANLSHLVLSASFPPLSHDLAVVPTFLPHLKSLDARRTRLTARAARAFATMKDLRKLVCLVRPFSDVDAREIGEALRSMYSFSFSSSEQEQGHDGLSELEVVHELDVPSPLRLGSPGGSLRTLSVSTSMLSQPDDSLWKSDYLNFVTSNLRSLDLQLPDDDNCMAVFSRELRGVRRLAVLGLSGDARAIDAALSAASAAGLTDRVEQVSLTFTDAPMGTWTTARREEAIRSIAEQLVRLHALRQLKIMPRYFARSSSIDSMMSRLEKLEKIELSF